MKTIILGSSNRHLHHTVNMIRFASDFHYGMMGLGRTFSSSSLGISSGYKLYDFYPDSWYAQPDMPDTSYAAVQKTSFYARSVKSGTPSTLLTNLIGRI